jgi:probable F420-dependent oxidoreductase
VRLGISFSHPDLGGDPGFYKEFAQSAEEGGFDHLIAAEHVLGGHPDRLAGEKVHTYDIPYHEPFVLFGFLGAITTRLELVTGILILPQRQTALVAKQAAELDLLTGGRLRLGVGVGRNWMEYEALNEEFSNRGARLAEQVEVLRRLWSEELVTYDGQWHHLDRVGLNPLGVQRPIPIWMGSYVGQIVERVLRRIATMADGWFPQFPPGDELRGALDRLRGYARDAGRDPDTIGIECGMSIKEGDEPERWIERAVAFRDLGATHLRVITAGGGFSDPAAHLAGALRWIDAVGPAAREERVSRPRRQSGPP